MLLKHKPSGKLVEVIDIYELTNPFDKQLVGCLQWGEDVPDPDCFDKQTLCFPSGEALPECWLDEHYRDEEILQHLGVFSDNSFSDNLFSDKPRDNHGFFAE